MLQTRVQIQVRYAETDMMGIVYHGNYLPWFEVARTTLLKERGVSYRQLETDGFRLPVIEAGMKFLRPALYDDTVTVVATLKERPSLRIRIDYEVFGPETAEPIAIGYTIHGFVNATTGRPTRAPAQFLEAVEEAGDRTD